MHAWGNADDNIPCIAMGLLNLNVLRYYPSTSNSQLCTHLQNLSWDPNTTTVAGWDPGTYTTSMRLQTQDTRLTKPEMPVADVAADVADDQPPRLPFLPSSHPKTWRHHG